MGFTGNMFTSFDFQQLIFWGTGALIFVTLFLIWRKVMDLSVAIREDAPAHEDQIHWLRHPFSYGPSRAVTIRVLFLLIFIGVFFFSMSPSGPMPDMASDNHGVKQWDAKQPPPPTAQQMANDAEKNTPRELKWVRDEKGRDSLTYSPMSSTKENTDDVNAILKRAQKRNANPKK